MSPLLVLFPSPQNQPNIRPSKSPFQLQHQVQWLSKVDGNVISLIVAGVSLEGTVVVAIYSAWKQQSLENLKHNCEIDKEAKRYSGPLAVAAWEL
jgi:hypothetical protein